MNLLKPKYTPKRSHPFLSFAGEFLIFALIFGIAWAAIFLSLNFKAYAARFSFDLGLNAGAALSAEAAKPDTAVKADEIIIPKIGVRAPIITAKSAEVNDVLEDLKNGAVLYPGSQPPGSKIGKTFILGHSSDYVIVRYKSEYPTVFTLIDKLEKGDEISVVYDGKTYKYRVVDKFIKTPSQIKTDVKEDGLYLFSCWPVGTDYKRMVVRAVLI